MPEKPYRPGEGTPSSRAWSTAPVGDLLVATADGDAAALGELFRRHGAGAVDAALRALLDAGEDEPAMHHFLRRAATLALRRPPLSPGARELSGRRLPASSRSSPARPTTNPGRSVGAVRA
jgi:hypothetical protein